MKTSAAFVSVLALGMAGAANAAPLLAVDFNSGSPTETDFNSQPDNNRTFGPYQVQTSVNTFFDRPSLADSGPMTYADLYRDFIYNNNANGTINFTISGLSAGTYDVRAYAYDHGTSGTHTITFDAAPSTTTTLVGSVGSVTYTGGNAPDFNTEYSAVIRLATTDGVLTWRATAPNTANSLRVNGFEINAIPEPTSLTALALGGLLGLRRRRSC